MGRPYFSPPDLGVQIYVLPRLHLLARRQPNLRVPPLLVSQRCFLLLRIRRFPLPLMGVAARGTRSNCRHCLAGGQTAATVGEPSFLLPFCFSLVHGHTRLGAQLGALPSSVPPGHAGPAWDTHAHVEGGRRPPSRKEGFHSHRVSLQGLLSQPLPPQLAQAP